MYYLYHVHFENGFVTLIMEYSGKWEMLWGISYFLAKARSFRRAVYKFTIRSNEHSGEAGFHTWCNNFYLLSNQSYLPHGPTRWEGCPKWNDGAWGFSHPAEAIILDTGNNGIHAVRLNADDYSSTIQIKSLILSFDLIYILIIIILLFILSQT